MTFSNDTKIYVELVIEVKMDFSSRHPTLSGHPSGFIFNNFRNYNNKINNINIIIINQFTLLI